MNTSTALNSFQISSAKNVVSRFFSRISKIDVARNPFWQWLENEYYLYNNVPENHEALISQLREAMNCVCSRVNIGSHNEDKALQVDDAIDTLEGELYDTFS